MSNILFVKNYTSIVEMIENVVKPEYYQIIAKMYETDPHDLVSPDQYIDQYAYYGIVYSYFNDLRKQMNIK